MKVYHSHTFQKLGFDVILEQLARRVSSEEAREVALGLTPSADADVVVPELQRVAEFQELLQVEDRPPAPRIPAISGILKKLVVVGNWLSVGELSRLREWLETVAEVRDFLKKRQEAYPQLHALTHQIAFGSQLKKQIGRLLDDNGNLRDDASPALANIRKNIGATSNSLRSTLYRLLRRAQEQGWSLDAEIALRNDRLVIPLKAEAKNQMPGFVQDVSQTGGTVYVEPAEALPLNNRIRELQIEERNEIIRILKQVTEDIRQHRESLGQFKEIMLQVDLIRAKARLADTLGACLPTVEPAGKVLQLKDAYYPLLLLKSQQESFQVIPQDILLNPDHRIMLISGPNAGGKSVALKTAGLLQLMLQSGMLVPVNEGSVFCFFDALFLDIGDEQSVDTDLSTYTSRLYAWRQMGDRMTKRSLFLIDEFGSGTDPKQGGAIAEAFLERFMNQRAYGIITTHYGNLKDYAELTQGIINAAMQFDTEELRPTYRLIDGMPGRSYAFEMAKRVGVHHTVLRRAKRKIGGDEIEIEKLRKELEKKSTELEKLVRENKNRQNQLDQLVTRTEEKNLRLQEERRAIINEAKQEARSLIERANRDIERTIREIKEAQAEKEQTRRLRKQLASSAPDASPESTPNASKPSGSVKKKKGKPEAPRLEEMPNSPLQEGDWVKLRKRDTHGQLVEIQGKRGVVASGDLRLTIKLNELVKIRPPKTTSKKTRVTVINDELPMKSVRMETDVMGMRVEAAISEVTRLVDDARLAGLKRVRILHGKGTGALREAIRQHLDTLPFVAATGDAAIEEGGAGWTVVQMD